jgi:hypothetical protein
MRTKQNKTKQNKTKQNKTKQNKTKQNKGAEIAGKRRAELKRMGASENLSFSLSCVAEGDQPAEITTKMRL